MSMSFSTVAISLMRARTTGDDNMKPIPSSLGSGAWCGSGKTHMVSEDSVEKGEGASLHGIQSTFQIPNLQEQLVEFILV
jgi:hypothetical protein